MSLNLQSINYVNELHLWYLIHTIWILSVYNRYSILLTNILYKAGFPCRQPLNSLFHVSGWEWLNQRNALRFEYIITMTVTSTLTIQSSSQPCTEPWLVAYLITSHKLRLVLSLSLSLSLSSSFSLPWFPSSKSGDHQRERKERIQALQCQHLETLGTIQNTKH